MGLTDGFEPGVKLIRGQQFSLRDMAESNGELADNPSERSILWRVVMGVSMFTRLSCAEDIDFRGRADCVSWNKSNSKRHQQ